MRAFVGLASMVMVTACGPTVGADGSSTGGSTGTGDSTGPGSATEVVDSATGSTGADSTTGPGDDPAQDHVQAYCEAWLSVECPFPRYDSLDECIEHYGAELAPYFEMAEAGLYVFDEECAALRVETLVDGASCENGGVCSMFHGFGAEGSECDTVPWGAPATSCGAGLSCYSSSGLFSPSVCLPTCSFAAQGDSCASLPCDDGLWCDYVDDVGSDGTCEPIPGPGDPCATGMESPCGLEMWCDGGTCSDQYGGVGAPCAVGAMPCDLDVAYCDYDLGECVPLLPLDSPCTSWWQCESTACVLDVCVPVPDAVGLPCHQEKRCAGGLECDGMTFTCREPFTSPVCAFFRWCSPSVILDGVCQEGDGPDDCPPNTDPSDCGYCPQGRQGDGQCDDGLFCAEGTDPDC